MELATLAAPWKPARGREGGWRSRNNGEVWREERRKRREEQRKMMHLYSGTDA